MPPIQVNRVSLSNENNDENGLGNELMENGVDDMENMITSTGGGSDSVSY